MNFIFGNYGDNTIAVIQWAHLNQLDHVAVVHVETGWGATSWQKRIQSGQQLAHKYQFKTVTLKSSHGFLELVSDRKSFPTAKYGWCSTFLKALPFISWLDEVDAACEAMIILGARRADSRARTHLSEFIIESEYYGDRRLWHPLFNATLQERDQLIRDAGFTVLNHRSLECDPCIHSHASELSHLEENKVQQIKKIEDEIEQTMFHARYANQDIYSLVSASKEIDQRKGTIFEVFDMGCGSRYACGE